MNNDVYCVILCGGKGNRLRPLTDYQAKPAVLFGGKYRIVDFVLSNLVNSGFSRISGLVQYRSQSLEDYIRINWTSVPRLSFHVNTISPQQMLGEEWYRGTADAVFQNLEIIRGYGNFGTFCIMAGDHVTAMNVAQIYAFHKDVGASFTVCAMSVPSAEAAKRFGVIEVDDHGRITGFEEKPDHPKEIPGRPGWCYISLGNYFAEYEALVHYLTADASQADSSHDFGKDIIPHMVAAGERVYAYDYRDNRIPGQEEHYWEDVGTIWSYWKANMDLVQYEPKINLYNPEWPIRTAADNLPGAKFVRPHPTLGFGERAMVSGGDIVQDTSLRESILGRNVRIYGSELEQSIVFSHVVIEHGCRLHRTIVERGIHIPPGTRIGFDHAADTARNFVVDESGIVIVPAGYRFS